jgi:hypothetical protein
MLAAILAFNPVLINGTVHRRDPHGYKYFRTIRRSVKRCGQRIILLSGAPYFSRPCGGTLELEGILQMTTYFADGREALIRVHCDGWHDLAAFFAADAERFTARGRYEMAVRSIVPLPIWNHPK